MHVRELLGHLWVKTIPIVGILAGGAAFVLGLFLVSYEATGSVTVHPLDVMTESSLTTPQVGMVSSPQVQLLSSMAQSYLSLAKSRALIDRVVRRLDLDAQQRDDASSGLFERMKQPVRFLLYGRLPSYKRTAAERVAEKTLRGVRTKHIVSSNVILITARSSDARKARDIANAVIEEFVDFGRQKSRQSTSNTLAYLDVQLKAARAARDGEKLRLDDIVRRAGLARFDDLPAEVKRVQAKLVQAQDALEQHDELQPQVADRLRVIEATLAELPEYERLTYLTSRNPAVERMRERVLGLEIEKQNLLVDYAPESVQIGLRTKEIGILTQALDREVQQLLQSEQFQLDARRLTLVQERLSLQIGQAVAPFMRESLNRQIARHTQRLSELDALSVQEAETKRALLAMENRESDLILLVQQAQGVALQVAQEIEILDPARMPRYPSFKGVPLIAFAVLASVAAMVLTAMLILQRAGAYHGTDVP